jgi:hypothetical protein
MPPCLAEKPGVQKILSWLAAPKLAGPEVRLRLGLRRDKMAGASRRKCRDTRRRSTQARKTTAAWRAPRCAWLQNYRVRRCHRSGAVRYDDLARTGHTVITSWPDCLFLPRRRLCWCCLSALRLSFFLPSLHSRRACRSSMVDVPAQGAAAREHQAGHHRAEKRKQRRSLMHGPGDCDESG